MTLYDISLLIGDGIGPELSVCVEQVLNQIHDKSSSLRFTLAKVEAGDNALSKYGKALPDDTFERIKKSKACLKSPVGESAADVVLVLRRYFERTRLELCQRLQCLGETSGFVISVGFPECLVKFLVLGMAGRQQQERQEYR